jgi:hypothetical protein
LGERREGRRGEGKVGGKENKKGIELREGGGGKRERKEGKQGNKTELEERRIKRESS